MIFGQTITGKRYNKGSSTRTLTFETTTTPSGGTLATTGEGTDKLSGVKQTLGSLYRSHLSRDIQEVFSMEAYITTIEPGSDPFLNIEIEEYRAKTSLVESDIIVTDINSVQQRTYRNDATSDVSTFWQESFIVDETIAGNYTMILEDHYHVTLSKSSPGAAYGVTCVITWSVFDNPDLRGGELTVNYCPLFVPLEGFGVNTYYMPGGTTYVNSVELTFGTTGADVTFGGPTVISDQYGDNFSQFIPPRREPPPAIPQPTGPLDWSGMFGPTPTMWGAFCGKFGSGVYNIGKGAVNIGKELGCTMMDTALGGVTAVSMLTGNPVVFDAWSNSLQALESGEMSVGGYYLATIPNMGTFGAYGQATALNDWRKGLITDEEMQQIVGGTAIWQSLPAAMKYGPRMIPKPATKLPADLNYTNTVRNHLNNPSRFVPQEIIRTIIEKGKPFPDPQGTNASMHYGTMWKNGKPYNIEVLYDYNTNTVMHVMYTQKPIGPLPIIP